MTNVIQLLNGQKRFSCWTIILFFFLVTAANSNAYSLTSYKISGSIQSLHSGRPIAFASVALYKRNDSLLVTGTISNDEGSFEIETGESGDYFLEIRIVGFADLYVDQININGSNPHIDLGIITIDEQSIELDEVVITGERSAIEYKIDRQVLDVSKLGVPPSAPLSQALQVLPSIETDISGNVSLRGSQNFQVMIDGRLTILSPSEVLKQYSVSQIEKVEIITNPSARYRADNTSGIINIILKKGEGLGLSGIVNLGVSKGIAHFQPYNFRSTLTYRRPKFSLTATLNHMDERVDWEFERYQTRLEGPNVLIDANNHVPWKRGRASLDVDYYISDKHTLTAALRIMQQDYEYNMAQGNYFLNVDSSFYSGILGNRDRHTRAATLHDAIKFDEDGHELRLQTTLFNRKITEEQEFLQSRTISESEAELQRRFAYTHDHHELQFQADYTRPFGEDSRLESGLSLFAFTRDVQREEEVIQPDPLSGNSSFEATAETYAGYLTYKRKWMGIDAQLGLRAEYYGRLIDLEGSDDAYPFSKLNFFPGLHLAKEFNEKQNMRISYTRRIRRPSMRELSPYIDFGDNLASYSGNPDLVPENINSIELSYTQMFEKVTATMETYFRHTLNPISTGDRLDEETGIIAGSPVNVDHSRFYGVEPSVNIEATEWWRINTSGTWYQNRISGELFESEINQQYNGWRVRLNNRINLSENIQFSINGFYNSKVLDIQGENGAQYWMDVAVSAKFFKEQATLNLSMRDVFGSRRFSFIRAGEGFVHSVDFLFPRKIVGIDLTYRFNNYKNKKYRFDFED